MARCLVTGHKGYIGSKLFARLQELGHEVIGVDLNDKIPHDILKVLQEGTDGRFHPHYFNFKPEYIFHLACWPRIGYCMENPVDTMRNNVLAGSILLNFARKVGTKRLIYSSSSSVAGNGEGPTNPYALQKLVTEIESKIYSEIYGLDTVSLRYFNVYSEDQTYSGAYTTAVASWMHCIREKKQPFITGDGNQRRDMVHVDDAVSANIFAMNSDKDFSGKNFDVGTGDNISLNEIREVIEVLHPNVNFEYRDSRPNEVDATKADIFPLKSLGWQAEISIKRGVFRCFKQLQKA